MLDLHTAYNMDRSQLPKDVSNLVQIVGGSFVCFMLSVVSA